VETHLKHVVSKLGLRSRAELAAVAASARTRPPDT
jgi:DNA-binding CsgD family transcriptional regulator